MKNTCKNIPDGSTDLLVENTGKSLMQHMSSC